MFSTWRLFSLSLSVSHSFVYRENGGKGVRAGHHQHQELQQQQSVVQSTSSGSGSGSMAPATASVAMWTAISNPLLLISHVLRRSMDLQQSSGVNDESMTVESDETSHRQQEQAADDMDDNIEAANINSCCEYVSIEQHAEPMSANANWQNQTIEEGPFIPTSSVSSRYGGMQANSLIRHYV